MCVCVCVYVRVCVCVIIYILIINACSSSKIEKMIIVHFVRIINSFSINQRNIDYLKFHFYILFGSTWSQSRLIHFKYTARLNEHPVYIYIYWVFIIYFCVWVSMPVYVYVCSRACVDVFVCVKCNTIYFRWNVKIM